MDIIEVKGNADEIEGIGMFIKTEMELETAAVSEPNNSCGKRTEIEVTEYKPEIRHVCEEKYKKYNEEKDIDTGRGEISNVRRRSSRKVKRKVDDNFEYITTKEYTSTSRRQSEKTKSIHSKSSGVKNTNQDNWKNKNDEQIIKKVPSEMEQLQIACSMELVVDDAADENYMKSCDLMNFTKTHRGSDESKGSREKYIKTEIELESSGVNERNNSGGEKIDIEDTECKPDIRHINQNSENKDEDTGRGGIRSKDFEKSNVKRRGVRKGNRNVDDNFENVKAGKYSSRRKSGKTESSRSIAKNKILRKINKRNMIENTNDQLTDKDLVNLAEEHEIDGCTEQNHKNSSNFVREVMTEIMHNSGNTGADKDSLANTLIPDRELRKNLILCNFCGTSFETENAVKKHLIETHNVKPTKSGNKKEKVLVHECTYKGCEKIFKSKWILKKHVDGVHLDIRKYQCDSCGLRFHTPWHLKSHISRRHTEDKKAKRSTADKPFRYKCIKEGCSTVFTDKWARTKHVNAVHLNIRKHQCEFCGFRFKTGNALRVHLVICNTKDKKSATNICDVCGKSFFMKWRLKTHETVHTDTKVFTCNFDKCGKSFRLKCGLKKHEMIHKGVKPFQCDICHERFRRKGYLETHMYKHTGMKKYSCEICCKGFSQKGNLKVHKLLHDKERPVYKCEKCSYKSNFKSNLTKHLLQHDEHN